MNKLDKKYANLEPEEMRVLLEQKDSEMSLLKLRLQKDSHLLRTVLEDNRKRAKPPVRKPSDAEKATLRLKRLRGY